MPFRPVIDGRLIPDKAEAVYKSHLVSEVDFLMGCNSHEGALFTIGPMKIKSFKNVEEAKSLVKRLLHECFWGSVRDEDAFADEVTREYLLSRNVRDVEELQKGMVDLVGDVWFTLPTLNTADRHSGKKCKINLSWCAFLYLIISGIKINLYLKAFWDKSELHVYFLYLFNIVFCHPSRSISVNII